uniref:histidine kinase n=1 Tax=Chromera velia CCMP2878 TaxID=1169474 RepID=A0A0G4GJZ0_9ALVE|eukprot:Cvel_22223.t1-p1 / transcript=Cvel_22223.t1 / gene=Cvel_22223 / organism=Chromera_velia_CCMP2878 / gene_product=hypothetical protein / transcript_product=hypothetical protein / location=Cvel_scaffold2161:26355-30497(+) / protein_length=876 / sequence_SO=supercontig / SO=protein_coding / is_pseudo=false
METRRAHPTPRNGEGRESLPSSFEEWRIDAVKQQLARANKTILFGFLFICVAALPKAIWDAAQPEAAPFFSYLFVAYIIIDLVVLGVLLSPWLRARPYQMLEKYLIFVLFVFLVLNNVWPLVAFRAVTSRQGYIATHCIDGLVFPIIFSLFDLHPTANLFLLVTHGTIWAGVHSWLTDFDAQDFGSTTCYLLVGLMFCGTNASGRLGTLRDSFDMTALKQEAEEGYRRFLSYMMHEMRNPIGGAMFLLDDLEHTNRRVLMTTKARSAKTGKGMGGGTGRGTKGSSSSGLSRRSLTTAPEFWELEVQAREAEFLHGRIRASLEMMKSVCDDVLTIEKVQKKGFEYFVTVCSPLSWVEELSDLERVSMLSSKIDFKVGIEVAQDLDSAFESKRVAVAADWLHLRQVAVNFLSNARKFTGVGGKVALTLQIDRLQSSSLPSVCFLPPPGEIEALKASERTNRSTGRAVSPKGVLCDVLRSSSGLPDAKDVPGWVRVEFRVTDSGSGLSASEMDRLFLPYSQIRAGELQRGGGTGLGLCISKMFVEAHWGGRVGVTSDGPGLGSSFFFSVFLPLVSLPKRRSTLMSPSGNLPSAFPFSVSSRTREEMKRRNSGAPTDDSPVSVTFGDEPSWDDCQTELLSGSGARKVNFPSIPSFASPVTSRRRRAPHLASVFNRRQSRSQTFASNPHLPGILAELSGEDTRESPKEASPVSFLPVPSPKAQQNQNQVAELEPEEMPQGLPSTMLEQVRTHAKDFDCLVVDDIWICAFGGFRAMERLGYRPWMCLSGERALEIIRTPGAVDRLRVILMDKDMAGIDGPETIRRLRDFFAEQGVRQPVVVGVTGEVAGHGMNVLKEAGCDLVFSKPLRPDALKEGLQQCNR